MRILASFLIALAVSGCGIPLDPEGTFERVSDGVLRVGVVEAHPWAFREGDEAAGIEVELVKDFAVSIDADIEWFYGSESELFAALHVQELHLVIGGIDSVSPFSTEAALTHPYVTTQTVVAFPSDEDIPEDIAGVRVAVETGTEEAGLLEKTDAIPVPVEDLTEASGPLVTENFHLDDLDVVDSGVQLKEVDHVMGAPLGENRFLVELERFLLESPDRVTALLEAAEP